MPTGPALGSLSAPRPAAPSPLVPDVCDPLADRCPCVNAGDVTQASNAASSRQRVTTSQVVLSSVGLRSSNPSNPSWSSTAPALAPKRRASSSPLFSGTVMALILMTVIHPSWHRRGPARRTRSPSKMTSFRCCERLDTRQAPRAWANRDGSDAIEQEVWPALPSRAPRRAVPRIIFRLLLAVSHPGGEHVARRGQELLDQRGRSAEAP